MKIFKTVRTFIIVVVAAIVSGCTADMDKLNDRLDGLEDRIEALEELCSQMNSDIASLKTIVEALQNADYITDVVPVTENGTVIGYEIHFAKSGTITIYHGKDGEDGQDGYTPEIGVRQDTDGRYYWTLDGEWLLDDNGNKIHVNREDGQDGITPILKIEDGYWYVSYDNGATWTQLGKATGEDGQDGETVRTVRTVLRYSRV